MAVENDYNVLVVNLNHIAQNIEEVRREVEERLLREKRERLEPNADPKSRVAPPLRAGGVVEQTAGRAHRFR